MHQKASLRNLYLHKRSVLGKDEQEQLNGQILEKLSDLLQTLSFSTVHTFLPQTGKKEIDTQRIIAMIRQNFSNVKIIAPRVLPGTRRMEHYFLTSETRLVLNRWLIPEPDPASSEPADIALIDLVLIPLLAFDERGFRVGYGGGYYDRFLSECNPGVLKIGVSYFDPVSQIEDIDPFDVPLDYCITPQQTFNWNS